MKKKADKVSPKIVQAVTIGHGAPVGTPGGSEKLDAQIWLRRNNRPEEIERWPQTALLGEDQEVEVGRLTVTRKQCRSDTAAEAVDEDASN